VKRLALAAILLLPPLAACERANAQLEAAQDVRAFIVAVKEQDRTAFDRHVDREALKADVRRQLQARGAEGDPAGLLLGSRQGERLLDGLIAPESFNFALQQAGPVLDRTPSAPEIAALLKPAGENRLCLPEGGVQGPCAVTFAKQGDDWRLVSINIKDLGVTNLPFPPSAAG
jgi:hypothetical protein